MNSSVNLFNESELSRYDLGIPEYYVNENGEATIYIEPSLFVNPIDAETEQLQVESYCISITADRLEDLEEKEGIQYTLFTKFDISPKRKVIPFITEKFL